ncbi:MAG: efflux RND transporter periplasmic adaptor subunit, partial [Gammaproteobacteria bacterium]|nr:efflux RND transporter periplasmic adaptor subunit [Gammaproteobacteria bacterium]
MHKLLHHFMIYLFHKTPARHQIIRLIAGATLLIGMAACSEDNSIEAKRHKDSASPVELATVTLSPLLSEQNLVGTLQAVQRVRIFNQESGRIEQIPHYPGDKVAAKDLLVKIDDSLLQSELDKARSSLKQATLDHKRLISLVPRKLASEDELNRAQTSVELARAELASLETRLQHTLIRAPFAGLISERLFEPGDVAPLNSHILTLYAPDDLKIELPISELLLNQLNIGDTVSIRIDALSETQWPGTIKRIYPAVDSQTHQGTIEIKLDPGVSGARPGLLCRVNIKSSTSPRLTMPFAALRHNNQGEYVFRVDQ